MALTRVSDDFGSGGSGLNPKPGSRRFTSLASVLQGMYDAIIALTGAPIASTQFGTATLASGTATVSTATVTANSRIFLCRTAAGGTTTSTLEYGVITKTPGAPGSFVINAQVAAGTINAADNSVLDWLVVG